MSVEAMEKTIGKISEILKCCPNFYTHDWCNDKTLLIEIRSYFYEVTMTHKEETERRHKERLALYHQGVSDVEISKKLGIALSTVYSWRKKHSLKNLRSFRSLISKLNSVDCAYIAGFTDADGCISILNKSGLSKYKSKQSYQAVWAISNSNKDILRHLSSLVNGGYISTNSTTGIHLLAIRKHADLAQLLPQLLPHLLLKKREAQLVLEFVKLRLERFGQSCSSDEKTIFEKCREMASQRRENRS